MEKIEKVSVMALEGRCQEEIDLSLFYENQDPGKLIMVAFVNGDEAQLDYPESTLRNAARKYTTKRFQNKTYINRQTEWEIRLRRHSTHHEQRGSDATFLSYAAIPQLIENGVLIRDEIGRANKPYVFKQYFFLAPLRIGKELYRVR